MESAEKELLKIESELISRLESAKTAFSKGPEYLKLEDQLKKLDTQKGELETRKQELETRKQEPKTQKQELDIQQRELDIQQRELYSKMYERVLSTREKLNELERKRVEKEYKLEIENFKLELGKKLKSQKILSGELSLATTEEEREAVEKVQKNIEKRIEYLQGQINHCEKMIKFNSGFSQEPSSNSSSSSDSSSSLSLSYSSSSSSSSDSTTSETSPSSSSASPMDLISLASPVSSSYTGSNLSEEVPTAGDSAQEGSDS